MFLRSFVTAPPTCPLAQSKQGRALWVKRLGISTPLERAFTKGFTLVKESAKTKIRQVVRLYLYCVRHRKATKNNTSSKKRTTRGSRLKLKHWTTHFPSLSHTRARALDDLGQEPRSQSRPEPRPLPVSLVRRQAATAIALAALHWGELTYKQSVAILDQKEYEIKEKKF